MTNNVNKTSITSAYWVEKVVIITDNYEITGNIYMPKTTKKSSKKTRKSSKKVDSIKKNNGSSLDDF